MGHMQKNLRAPMVMFWGIRACFQVVGMAEAAWRLAPFGTCTAF